MGVRQEIVNTDNRLMSGTTVTEEYLIAIEDLGFA